MNKRLFKSVIASSILASSLLSVTPVFADEFDEKIQDAQYQAQENEQAADDLNHLINQLTNDMQNTQQALDNLNAEISRNEASLTTTLGNLQISTQEMQKLLEEIAVLEKNIEERSEKLEKQARIVQVNGNPTNYVEFILNAETLTDVIARIDVVTNLVESSNRMIEDQLRDQKAVETKSEETERKIVQQNALVEELEATSAGLEVQKASQSALIAQIDIERSTVASERDGLIAKRNEALQLVNNIQNEQEAVRVATEQAQRERAEIQDEEERRQTAQVQETTVVVEPASSARESVSAPTNTTSNNSNNNSNNLNNTNSSNNGANESANSDTETHNATPAPTPTPTPPKKEEEKEEKPAPKPTPAPSGNVLSIAAQYTYVNTYTWGGTTAAGGFDCSGFTQFVFKEAGKSIPRDSRAQYSRSTKVSNPQPGDLVFFSGNRNGVITHVGIYTGGGQFIGSQSSTGVAYASAVTGYWGSRLVGYGRY